MASRILDLSSTQRLVLKPADRFSSLDHAWVYNPAVTVVYLNVWDSVAVEGSPTPAIADAVDQIPIAAGFCGLVYIGAGASRSIVISASTATNGTGAPSVALGVSLRWA